MAVRCKKVQFPTKLGSADLHFYQKVHFLKYVSPPFYSPASKFHKPSGKQETNLALIVSAEISQHCTNQ